MKTIIPSNYQSKLSINETQLAIGYLKDVFAEELSIALNVKRVSAPLFVKKGSGLNDNLNGFERPVDFDIKTINENAEIVHSLAKWKRLALYEYDFQVGSGLYTDMNAIRRDEDLDNIHSIYVDQWDWEKVIKDSDRNINYLKNTVRSIIHAISETNKKLNWRFPSLSFDFKDEVTFITTQELEDLYPSLTPKEREKAFVKEHGNTFLMQIGYPLKSGKPHDGRAPDYDDWMLNGDILVYNELLDIPFELSSMGIRVNSESLIKQLTISNNLDRLNLSFHQMLVNNQLPLCIGGGIGQSRLSMLLLEKAHIGEVQVSIWDIETLQMCSNANIKLL